MEGRINYFSFLNVLSCFFVCAMHHNVLYSYLPDDISMQVSIVHILGSFAVPVFFMLSGATLMDYRHRYSTREYLMRRVKKVFVPFVIWQFIWFAICTFVQGKDEFLSFHAFVDGFVNCNFQKTYWFFVPLFFLYALMPVLSVVAKNKQLLQYLIIFMVIIESVLLPLIRLQNITVNETLHNGGTLPLLYALLGYYLREYNLSRKCENSIIVLSLLLLVLELIICKVDYSALNYYTKTGLTTIFYSSSVFLLAKRFVSDESSFVWKKLSTYSFGIYLIHIVVIYAEKRVFNSLFGLGEESIIWRIPMAIVTYGMCLLSVYIYHYITDLLRHKHNAS